MRRLTPAAVAAAALFVVATLAAPAPAQACGPYGSPEEMAVLDVEWSTNAFVQAVETGDVQGMFTYGTWALTMRYQLAELRAAAAEDEDPELLPVSVATVAP